MGHQKMVSLFGLKRSYLASRDGSKSLRQEDVYVVEGLLVLFTPEFYFFGHVVILILVSVSRFGFSFLDEEKAKHAVI